MINPESIDAIAIEEKNSRDFTTCKKVATRLSFDRIKIEEENFVTKTKTTSLWQILPDGKMKYLGIE